MSRSCLRFVDQFISMQEVYILVVFFVKTVSESPDSVEPSTPRRQVLGDNRVNGNLQATPGSSWLFTSPLQQPQTSDRVSLTPLRVTPRRPFLSEMSSESDWPVSLAENSSPSHSSSRTERQAVSGRRSDEMKSVENSAERSFGFRKRLSNDMYAENDDFGEDEPAIKHSTPDSKLLRCVLSQTILKLELAVTQHN